MKQELYLTHLTLNIGGQVYPLLAYTIGQK